MDKRVNSKNVNELLLLLCCCVLGGWKIFFCWRIIYDNDEIIFMCMRLLVVKLIWYVFIRVWSGVCSVYLVCCDGFDDGLFIVSFCFFLFC